MVIKFLDLHKQYLTIKEEIDQAIFEVISKSAFIGGSVVGEFEEAFSKFLGGGVGVLGVANGTDALEISIKALNLPKDSIVLVPANTFAASAEAVVNNGLKIKFVDCNESYGMDLEDLKNKITKEVSAILVVHLYGMPAPMNEILKLARKNNLKVIEDCAQAHGAEYRGDKVGTFGDIATFSFYPGKNLGAYGDGGAIVSKNEKLLQKCKQIAHHGGLVKYEHTIVGRNSRLDSIQAAILKVKLQYLQKWNKKRQEVAKMYYEGLKEVELPKVSEGESVWHLFVVRFQKREKIIEALKNKNIEYGLHYPIALPNTPAFYKQTYVVPSENKRATFYQGQILSLPMGEHLEVEEVQRIIKVVNEAVSGE
ncbi:erythromycin biosynthesis sensory transduction protein eryC1 [Helicobacter valdiviensis]|uniref:Erythromycin biosynthesis sensory transduction protein eryC1 n=1 Tax=Helicobacter valdiviensis TaxID=1458358 RepID=A0A2W6MUB0_9HELI|nr:DegT/DnrJ/EryC1/StrS family aminotransferase [Helicobacter valdiviensis]PZT48047.1 erythromycin biosynthesis sensory transduction protein eryC1 [Helicobacter valdiviensis]